MGSIDNTNDKLAKPNPLLQPSSAQASDARPWWSGVPSTEQRTGLELERERRLQIGSGGIAAPPSAKSAAKVDAQNGSPSPAGNVQSVANRNESELSGRQGAYMETNNLRQFEDKGSGIVRQVGSDGRITLTNVGTAGVTDQNKTVPVTGVNLAADNAAMARANAARESMIDSMIKANGGNGVAVLPDPRAQQTGQGMSISDIQSAMKSAGTRTERAAYGQMLQTALSGQNQLAQESMRQQGIMAGLDVQMRGQDVQMRGQDIAAKSDAARLAGNPLDQQIKQNQIDFGQMANATAKQLQNLHAAYGAEKDPAKQRLIAEQIRALSGKGGADRFIAVQGGEEIGPDGMTTIRRPSSIFDTSTRQFVSSEPQQAAPKFGKADVDAAIAKGADKAKISERIKSMGGNPADYGL